MLEREGREEQRGNRKVNTEVGRHGGPSELAIGESLEPNDSTNARAIEVRPPDFHLMGLAPLFRVFINLARPHFMFRTFGAFSPSPPASRERSGFQTRAAPFFRRSLIAAASYHARLMRTDDSNLAANLTAVSGAAVRQRCLNAECARAYSAASALTACPACHEPLDVVYDFDLTQRHAPIPPTLAGLLERAAVRSLRQRATQISGLGVEDGGGGGGGVWSFRELFPFHLADPQQRAEGAIVSVGEGRTQLQRADALGSNIGFAPGRLFLQYEGFNPSGSFKDNGMTAGFTHARMIGATTVACASTGNTSASLALYAAHSGLRAFVFIGDGKIAMGKLSQALDYGAVTLQIAGDFDDCLARVREIAEDPANGVYLLNSVNPFRLEGQKSIMLRVLRDLYLNFPEGLRDGRVPDWIVVPGGNLGNCSAFAKAFIELRALGLIDRLPRLAVINAAGASTLDRLYNQLGLRWTPSADPLMGTYDRELVRTEYARMDAANERANTIASAIEINRPVNLPKALRALHAMNGVVISVDDRCILEHKALVGRFGCGCEPASAASVAGARRLRASGIIAPDESVVCVLTGHQLKDPDATVGYHTAVRGKSAGSLSLPTGSRSNRPVRVGGSLDDIKRAMAL